MEWCFQANIINEAKNNNNTIIIISVLMYVPGGAMYDPSVNVRQRSKQSGNDCASSGTVNKNLSEVPAQSDIITFMRDMGVSLTWLFLHFRWASGNYVQLLGWSRP